MAQSVGINTSRLFSAHLRARQRARRARRRARRRILLAIAPGYALDNLVYFLIVVAVGGLGSIRGPFVAALLVGIADTAFKYHRARVRRLLHLCADHGAPAVAAARPVRARMTGGTRPDARPPALDAFARRHRFRSARGAALARGGRRPISCFRTIWRSARRSSPPSCSRSRSIWCSAMPASSRSATPPSSAPAPTPPASSPRNGWGEPITGLLAAAAAAGAGRVSHRRRHPAHHRAHAADADAGGRRHAATSSPTRRALITGGADGLQGMEVWPIFGAFRFDLFGRTAYIYCLAVLFLCWLVVRAHRPFAVRPLADRHPRERAAHARDRRAGRAAASSSSTRSRRRSPASPAR